MTTGVIGTLPKKQFFDNNGHVAVGYKLYTYQAGTTTNATTWQDQGLTSANTNPITLDARGECSLWLDPAQEYKLVLKTAGGTTVWTQDDVNGALSSADTLAQIQNQASATLSAVAGTNTITATATPTPDAYAVGQAFEFIPANTNSGATTLNISSLGAGAIQANGSALVGGELRQNVPVRVKVTAATPVFEIIGNGAASTPLDVATHAATSKATPVDADELPLVDSAASNGLKKLTWANLKATLKTYFDTLYSTLTAASTAEAQAGTDNTKAITPLRLRDGLNASGTAPIYACRAWVNFNGTGTVAIRASGNVSSITDNGTGDYTVNFTTAISDTNYAVSLNGTDSTTMGSALNAVAYQGAKATGSVRVGWRTASGAVTFIDALVMDVAVFR